MRSRIDDRLDLVIGVAIEMRHALDQDPDHDTLAEKVRDALGDRERYDVTDTNLFKPGAIEAAVSFILGFISRRT
jgi:hypothetical protein